MNYFRYVCCVCCVSFVCCVSSVRPKCPTSAGMARLPNGAWMLLAVSGGSDAPPPRPPLPPGRLSVCVGRGQTVCVGRTPTSVWKLYAMNFK